MCIKGLLRPPLVFSVRLFDRRFCYPLGQFIQDHQVLSMRLPAEVDLRSESESPCRPRTRSGAMPSLVYRTR